MTESAETRDEIQIRLEQAEEQDAETRLQALEALHAELEAELARDVPAESQ